MDGRLKNKSLLHIWALERAPTIIRNYTAQSYYKSGGGTIVCRTLESSKIASDRRAKGLELKIYGCNSVQLILFCKIGGVRTNDVYWPGWPCNNNSQEMVGGGDFSAPKLIAQLQGRLSSNKS